MLKIGEFTMISNRLNLHGKAAVLCAISWLLAAETGHPSTYRANTNPIQVKQISISENDNFEAIGDLRFAVVLLDYANDGSAPSVESVEEGLFEAEYSVANFIDEASYGKTTISGDIFGWIVPPRPLYGSGWTSCWPLDQDRFNLLLKNYPNISLHDYDGFIFYVNRPTHSECDSFGVSNTVGIEPRPTYTSFGVIDTRILYFSTKFYLPYQAYSRITDSTAAHEIIHSLGIGWHSLSYTCGDQILSTNFSDCETQAYGDIFSIMGLRSQASLPDVVVSESLGWMDDIRMKTVQGSGRFTINSLEDKTENLKAIKIPLDQPIDMGGDRKIDHIYVEYRGMTGFDERNSFFRNIALENGSQFTIKKIHGALIHGADCSTDGRCIPYLLNMHPNSIRAAYAPNKVAQAYLYEGETFSVPLNDIKIKVLEVAPERSIAVDIEFDETPKANPCPSQILMKAIPTFQNSSTFNWKLGATVIPLRHQNVGGQCDVCTYSSDRLIYNLSTSLHQPCPEEISVEGIATDGAWPRPTPKGKVETLPLKRTFQHAGVRYCSYIREGFAHDLHRCR
jgi:hypothetical protein